MTNLDFLKTIFDIVRIVDPKSKELINEQDHGCLYSLPYVSCFEVWKSNRMCNNCISLQSIKNNKTQMKLEEVAGRVFLVIAAPYPQEEKTLALELIKDITENNLIDIIQNANETNYHELIQDLNKAVITDALTNLYNKRYIMDSLPYHLKQAQYARKTIAVISADIDFFKQVNDQYGHCAGDSVLQKVGHILKDEVRDDSDWVARSGGEEFLIVLSNIDQKTLLSVCDRIRLRIENTDFTVNDVNFNITISMGGTFIEPDMLAPVEKIVEFADQLLYQSKNTGRNKCIIKKFNSNTTDRSNPIVKG